MFRAPKWLVKKTCRDDHSASEMKEKIRRHKHLDTPLKNGHFIGVNLGSILLCVPRKNNACRPCVRTLSFPRKLEFRVEDAILGGPRMSRKNNMLRAFLDLINERKK